jgi:hypothetical protein
MLDKITRAVLAQMCRSCHIRLPSYTFTQFLDDMPLQLGTISSSVLQAPPCSPPLSLACNVLLLWHPSSDDGQHMRQRAPPLLSMPQLPGSFPQQTVPKLALHSCFRWQLRSGARALHACYDIQAMRQLLAVRAPSC